jgi:hypothetical protein
VKNNLQVVASLLNIHGRSADSREAKAAYAAIGRRVDALSVVHRNHLPRWRRIAGSRCARLLTELAAELRASAPEEARAAAHRARPRHVYTTQDVAVAVAFLITEIVEFAMLHAPRTGRDLASPDQRADRAADHRSPVLLPDEATDDPRKSQFERIVGGLAKQLRSPLDRKLGRYSVDLAGISRTTERKAAGKSLRPLKKFSGGGTEAEKGRLQFG